MTHTVVLVGCGAAKRDRYCAAKDLYTSTYFEKKRAYAEAVGDSWFILSAKHKLFDPDRWLAPYDMTMDDVADTEQWARFVGGELHHHCSRTVDDDVEVIVLAGRDYTDPLRSVLEELNIEYRCPFDNTSGIGDQLAWLTERIDAASDQERVMTDGGQCAGGTEQLRLDGRTAPTRVGHCRHCSHDVYIGRGDGGNAHLLNTDIGDRGWLGNPYTVDEHGRYQCVERFRTAFEARLDDDPEFREAVKNLSGSVLGCWCQRLNDDGPLCHGEIIAEWADRLPHDVDTGTDRFGGGE